MAKPASKGNAFEQEVETLLRLKGYSVVRNELISGTQIDIAARKQDLLNNLSFVVECTDRANPVGVDLVKQKASILLSLKHNQLLFRLIFVARNGFTAESKAFADTQPNIVLLTLNELENQLIDFRPYADWYMHNYENSLGIFREGNLFGTYVELTAKDENDNLVLSLTAEAKEWLKDNSNNLLFLLADYGSGKTSFCRHLVYELLREKYRDARNQRYVPVLVNLRDYKNASNLQQVITDTLINQHGVALPSFMAFERFCSSGRILLVLDGFDEMTDRSDKKTLVDCFGQIYLLANLNAKIILTCRSNFFHSHSDVLELLKQFSVSIPVGEGSEQRLIQFTFDQKGRILYVERLSESQIREFVSNRVGKEADEVYALLKSIHDLSDLSTRPVLLDMILTTLPELRDKKKGINSAALYEYYTNRWTSRDEWRVHLPLKIRQDFCELLAWLMHHSSIQEVSYPFLERAMTDSLQDIARSDEKLEQFKNDIQTCSFLVRTGKESEFRFAHKSFLEFFVARKIVADFSLGLPLAKPASLGDQALQLREGYGRSTYRTIFHGDWLQIHPNETRRDGVEFFTMLLNDQLAKQYPPLKSEAEVRSQLQQSLRNTFATYVNSEVSKSFGISEEIGTFAIECLENLNIELQELLSRLEDENSLIMFCNILRLSKSKEYVRSNRTFLRSYVEGGGKDLVKASFASALAKNPDLIDIRLLEKSRESMSQQAWSFFLFEIASQSEFYADILRECFQWPDLRAIDRMICCYGLPVKLRGNEFKALSKATTKELLKSSSDSERDLGLGLCQLLSEGAFVEVVLSTYQDLDHSGKVEIVKMLRGLGGNSIRRLALSLWSRERDESIKKDLKSIEQRIRNSSSRESDRVAWNQVKSDKAIREQLWKSLRH